MKTNLLTLVITLTLGVILAGSLLVPVVEDAQQTAGDLGTLDNNESGVLYNSYAMGHMTASTPEVTILLADSVLTVNGTPVTIQHYGTLGQLAVSPDGSYLAVRNNAAAMYLYTLADGVYTSVTISPGTEVTVAYNGITVGDTTYPINDLYCIGVTSEDPVFRYTPTDSAKIYVEKIGDLFGTATITIDGESKTIAFVGDQATLTGYTPTVQYSLKAVDGYTDLYEVESYTITIGEGTATAVSWYASEYVTGHEASGAAFSLYGVLPVLVIIGLVIAAVSVVRNKD